MTPEYVFAVASKIPPSPSQIAEQKKNHPEYTLKSALTGWDGIEDSFDYIQWASDYAESGYSSPRKGILFANWNHASRRVQDILERMGYKLEWEDEWTTCSDCGKAFRTSPDSYSWQPSYVELQHDLVCLECLSGHEEEYLESLENNPNRAINVQSGINPEDFGYTLIQDGFENGWHSGQDDNPKTIYKDLRQRSWDHIVFEIDSVSQFYITFRAWGKKQ